ncbi:trimeric intracellular cation channel family protein [Limnobacter sp.]|uniref:trimeric intracellular cation channel family protein n=1 Tax=Limnobacter sp. TaxID=2003368 RepID=UPI003510F1E7
MSLDPSPLSQHIQLAIEVVATFAFALSGILEGARKRLDAVGVCVVAFLAAFGGGTLRDLLLDVRPFFWVKYIELLWAVFVLCILAMLFMRQRHFEFTERAIQWPDALGLGLFTAAGVFQAITMDMPPLVAVFMGVITGVFGGVLRDIVCNEIPNAFKDHRPYAICAFVGGWVYIGLRELGCPAYVNMLGCVTATLGLRVWAVWQDVRLPQWRN